MTKYRIVEIKDMCFVIQTKRIKFPFCIFWETLPGAYADIEAAEKVLSKLIARQEEPKKYYPIIHKEIEA